MPTKAKKSQAERNAEKIDNLLAGIKTHVPPLVHRTNREGCTGGENFDHMLQARFREHWDAPTTLEQLASVIRETRAQGGFVPEMGDGVVVVYWRNKRS